MITEPHPWSNDQAGKRHLGQGSMSSGQLEHGAGTFSARSRKISCTEQPGAVLPTNNRVALPTLHKHYPYMQKTRRKKIGDGSL